MAEEEQPQAGEGELKMDIRKHRFVPSIPTGTRIIENKKRKARRRQALKRLVERD